MKVNSMSRLKSLVKTAISKKQIFILYLILFLILLFGFAIRVSKLNYNSAFLDEAIYIILGKRILDGHILEVYGDISWVGGFPFFYPLISALFYSAGGLLATRMFQVFLGTIGVFFMYVITRDFKAFEESDKNKIAGLVAAAFMATAAIPISESRICTYNMLSFTLFLGGLLLLQKALNKRKSPILFASAFVFFLSFLAKYIVAIYFPLLILFTLYLSTKGKYRSQNLDTLEDFYGPLAFMTLVYGLFFFPQLLDFLTYQVATPSTTVLEVIGNFWMPSWFSLSLSVLAMIFFLRGRKRTLLLLLVAALLPLVVHILGRNDLSVAQHSFFSLVFLFPIIGIFFSFYIAKRKIFGTWCVATFIVLNLFYSLFYVRDEDNSWPNSDKAVEFLKGKISSEDKVLAEGSDIITLAFYDSVPLENIKGPFYFSYQNLEGLPAYLKAFQDKYFQFVQLEGTYFPEEDIEKIEESIDENYMEVFNDGYIKIYQTKQ